MCIRDRGEQGVIAALAHVDAGVDVRAALADQDIAGQHELTVGALDAQTLGLGITAVAGGTHALFMGEKLQTYFQHVLHLQDDNVIGVLLMQLGEVDHESSHQRLTGALGLSLIHI